MYKIEKINKSALEVIKNNLSFYDFNELNSIDNSGLIIEFREDIEKITYSDLQYSNGLEVFELRSKEIMELLKNILKNMDDTYYILVKYNEYWVVNEQESPELSLIMKNHEINNDFCVGLKISDDGEVLKLFIDSTLKYNSFIQIIFVDSKLIISPSDHMDIFINSDDIKPLEEKLTMILERTKNKVFVLKNV